MATRPERYGYDGLAQIAHAIRRVGAIYIATIITTPEEGEDVMYEKADRVAQWIRGKAGVVEDAAGEERPAPLGQQWPPPE